MAQTLPFLDVIFPDRLQLPEDDVRLAVRTQKPSAVIEQF